METTGHAWYSDPATVLGIAGIAVAVAFGLAGIWAAFRAAEPRRIISYRLVTSIPIVDKRIEDARRFIRVSIDDEPLENPTTMEVVVYNSGKRDLPTDAFDGGQPLRLKLHAPIKRVMNVTSNAEGADFRVDVDGSDLLLAPHLIKTGVAVRVFVLVDGENPRLSITSSPLIDFALQDRSDGELFPLRGLIAQTVAILGMTISATIGISYDFQNRQLGGMDAIAIIATISFTALTVLRWRKRLTRM